MFVYVGCHSIEIITINIATTTSPTISLSPSLSPSIHDRQTTIAIPCHQIKNHHHHITN
jgi:hypothetical protein